MKQSKRIINISIVLMLAICLITTGINAANLVGADSVQYKDTTVKAALDDLMVKVSACQDGALCSKVKLGDYVSMTPTSTSYSISTDLAGYASNPNIYPSELNLWRVIAINEDGTIDMVSEYVSSTNVTFQGKTGYLNLVGALNLLANQYGNSKYTIRTRYMGYNGQTATITDTSIFKNPATLTTSTTDNSKESVGGGDILYEKDTNLVATALGTLVATNPSGTTTSYWLASRYYYYSNSTYYSYNGLSVDTSGSIYYHGRTYLYSSGIGGWNDSSTSRALRPIVTLKSDINGVLGSGTSADPWVLQ